MPKIARSSPDNPDFARVVAVRGLPLRTHFAFDVEPDANEAAALARLLGARSVQALRLRGTLAPEEDGFTLDARLTATIGQTCVVTLDPVTTRIDTRVRRRFLPRPTAPGDAALDEDDDEIEPLGERIDLGLVAVEALSLALPDYPRKAGAALSSGELQDDAPAPENPFAALEALKDRRAGDEG